MAEHHEPGRNSRWCIDLNDSWGIDIEALHDEVQERQSHILEMDWTTLK